MAEQADRNLLWRKAAIIGSIWAASEIVLGSFLHNIRLPFKGEILTAIGIAIITAGHRLWPERGLLWRAGLICAAMKSISPSANLTGPMIAIAMEGILADFGNRILGQNNIGRIFGGGLAMTWAITHKLVNYFIAYGTDFTLAIDKTLQWFTKRFHFSGATGGILSNVWSLLGFAMLVYFLIGAAASLMGIISSKSGVLENRAVGNKEKTDIEKKDRNNAEGRETIKTSRAEKTAVKDDLISRYSRQFSYNPKPGEKKFSLILLFLQIAGILFVFSAGNKAPLVPFIALTVAYTCFCVFWYRRARRLIMRWGVWLSVIIASAVMGLVLGRMSAGIYLASRAVLMTFAFSAIGTELTNPIVRRTMERLFGPVFFDTLEYSFSALPGIIAAFPPAREILHSPLISLNTVISGAPYWLEASGTAVVLITGRQGSGKTTLAQNLITGLKKAGQRAGGFYAEGSWKEGHREGFTLVRADNGEKAPLSGRAENGHDCVGKYGPFFFYKEGFELGHMALSAEALKGIRFVFIDEAGPLELAGKGWAADISGLSATAGKVLVLCVRESSVVDIKRKWHFEKAVEISAGTDTEKALKILIEA